MGESSYVSTQSFVIAKLATKTPIMERTSSFKELPKIFSLGYGSTPVFKSLKRMPNGMYETVIDTHTLDLVFQTHKQKDLLEKFRDSVRDLYEKLLK